MAYKKKSGAMSSPFGENPNAGSIAGPDKAEQYQIPPEKSNVINGPEDLAKMLDEAYGTVCDSHNRAQDRLQKPTPPPTPTPPPPTPSADAAKVTEVIQNLIKNGATIQMVKENTIIASIAGATTKIEVE